MRAGASQEAAYSKAFAWRRERCQLHQMLLDRSRELTKETFNLVTQTSPVTLQKSSCGVMEGVCSSHRRREEGTECTEDFRFVLKGG